MPKPNKQNVQIQGETLEKMDILRDAARKQGLRKSYPGVVADAVNLFYDVSAGGRTVATADAVQVEREMVLGISICNLITALVWTGQDVSHCEFLVVPSVGAVGLKLPNGRDLLIPGMGAYPAKVWQNTRDLLLKSGVAQEEIGAEGAITAIDMDKLLGKRMAKK